MSTQSSNTRLQITRAGITTARGATEYLRKGLRYADHAWGFPDGSVLVFRGYRMLRDIDHTPVQVSRRRWAAYNPY